MDKATHVFEKTAMARTNWRIRHFNERLRQRFPGKTGDKVFKKLRSTFSRLGSSDDVGAETISSFKKGVELAASGKQSKFLYQADSQSPKVVMAINKIRRGEGYEFNPVTIMKHDADSVNMRRLPNLTFLVEKNLRA